jgi:hypothetical protein
MISVGKKRSSFADVRKRVIDAPYICGLLIPGFTHALRFLRVGKIAESDSYFRHVSLSVRMRQLGFHWTDFS